MKQELTPSRETGSRIANSAPDPLKHGQYKDKILVNGIEIEWDTKKGTCTFRGIPVALMWIDSTLAGLMAGVAAMVGPERFSLALQSEGRKSVESDWLLISSFEDFREGFAALNLNAAVAAWGDWQLITYDIERQLCVFRAYNNWEGMYQKALGVCWGSGMLAGKFSGVCSKLFKTNCWATQTSFVAKGESYDEFQVTPSTRNIEDEIEKLLVSDEATRADMAVAMASLARDIAERKKVEAENLRANVKLKRQSQVIARANIDLQRFAEVAAHHLQEPARRMATYAERLTQQLGGKLEDEQTRLSLEYIGQEARHQQNLLRDVERYLAADQPRGKVETQDAGKMVTRILADMAKRISEAGAEITLGNLPSVHIDAPRLEDVFAVALDNALRHGCSERPLNITIEGDRQGSEVCYRVSDNGPGMEAQYRERVFGVFERLSSSKTGTGIGLAILRRVAESCGGRAWIEETPGGGCRVLFELPIGKAGEPL